MKYSRRIFVSISYLLVGIALNVCYAFSMIDSFFGGLGTGLIVVGVIQVIRHIRYNKNEEYKEKVDVNINDERNKFLSSKAWAWAGYIFVIIAAIATIILRILSYNDYSQICAYAMCLIVILYSVSYFILSRKY